METKNVRKSFVNTIIELALKDPTFRNELINDPKPALKRVFGINIPDGLTVRIVEESENEVYLVIPCAMKREDELQEAELESVAGGWSGDCHPNTPDTVCNCNKGTYELFLGS
jgi:hypothetical protein